MSALRRSRCWLLSRAPHPMANSAEAFPASVVPLIVHERAAVKRMAPLRATSPPLPHEETSVQQANLLPPKGLRQLQSTLGVRQQRSSQQQSRPICPSHLYIELAIKKRMVMQRRILVSVMYAIPFLYLQDFPLHHKAAVHLFQYLDATILVCRWARGCSKNHVIWRFPLSLPLSLSLSVCVCACLTALCGPVFASRVSVTVLMLCCGHKGTKEEELEEVQNVLVNCAIALTKANRWFGKSFGEIRLQWGDYSMGLHGIPSQLVRW